MAIDPLEYSSRERLFLFFENGITLTVIGLIGGFAGVFIDGRYFLLLTIPLALGLHRSHALAGMRAIEQISAHLLVAIVASFILWPIGKGVNRSREHIPTAQEIAEYLLPALSQKGQTSVGPAPKPTPVQSFPQQLPERPTVSRDPIVRFPANVQIENPNWELSVRPPIGTTVEVQYVNGGPAVAKNLRAGADAKFGYDMPNDETEDRLFTQFINGKNSFGPPSDMIPGTKSWLHRFIPELFGNEMAELENDRRSLIVVGAITYADPTGNQRRPFCYSFIPIAETNALPQGEDPFKKHWRACQPKSLKRWQASGH
jgi:hypothetical protein